MISFLLMWSHFGILGQYCKHLERLTKDDLRKNLTLTEWKKSTKNIISVIYEQKEYRDVLTQMPDDELQVLQSLLGHSGAFTLPDSI